MSHVLLIAYDPGKLTGVASVVFDTETKHIAGFAAMQAGPTEVLDGLWVLISQVPITLRVVVGYERFTITERTTKLTRQYDALDFIGALKWIAHHCTIDIDPPRDPAAAKRAVSNDKLRALEFWTPAKEHANDAARHLVLMLLDRRWYSSVFD